MTDEYLEIGTIHRAHGLRGQLRVRLHDPGSRAFSVLRRICVGAERVPMPIAGVQHLGDGVYLLSLEGVADRGAAEGLAGQPLSARRDELPPLDEDEVYLSDLVGCTAALLSGEEVGPVARVQSLGGQDFLVIAREGREDLLIPAGPPILHRIDLEARRIQIDPPEGLLELDR